MYKHRHRLRYKSKGYYQLLLNTCRLSVGISISLLAHSLIHCHIHFYINITHTLCIDINHDMTLHTWGYSSTQRLRMAMLKYMSTLQEYKHQTHLMPWYISWCGPCTPHVTYTWGVQGLLTLINCGKVVHIYSTVGIRVDKLGCRGEYTYIPHIQHSL